MDAAAEAAAPPLGSRYSGLRGAAALAAATEALRAAAMVGELDEGTSAYVAGAYADEGVYEGSYGYSSGGGSGGSAGQYRHDGAAAAEVGGDDDDDDDLTLHHVAHVAVRQRNHAAASVSPPRSAGRPTGAEASSPIAGSRIARVAAAAAAAAGPAQFAPIGSGGGSHGGTARERLAAARARLAAESAAAARLYPGHAGAGAAF